MKSLINLLIVLLVIGGVSYGGWHWYSTSHPALTASYKTVELRRGDIMSTITATGTLEPEEVVDIGAQVAGQILSFGKDPKNPGKFIDYNTEVEKDTILALIDPALYQADVDQAVAQLDAAKANVDKTKADLEQAKAKFVLADRDWKRAQEARGNEATRSAIAQADYDTFESNYFSGIAAVKSADAALALANKSVIVAEVQQSRAVRNLSYCTIASPVKGVVIDRRVNIGQTVVSSLSAPSLFLIAKDLKRMQVWASINEADIGSIRVGQSVTFTVDALAGEEFKGVVGKIRMNATMTQNVVTYTVEVTTENNDLLLRAYQTANMKFEVDKRENVMSVPNAALRWAPTRPEQISEETRAYFQNQSAKTGKGDKSESGKPAANGMAGTVAANANSGPDATATTSPTTSPATTQSTRVRKKNNKAAGAAKTTGMIWVQDGNFAKPIKVKLGISDGTNTEVQAVELSEGLMVITGENKLEEAGGEARNPLMPQFGRGAGGGGGGRRGG